MARKILLADDSVTAQNMGRKILADAGYEVIAVNNGSAALKKIAEQRPDLIVLDVYMPGYSGLEVCQRLKETHETARIPILLTVGKLEPFKPEEAKRVRADGFIVKPFEASELLGALTKLEDKIVPVSEGSKPGRFARAIAAVEEGRYDKTVSGNEESGWKNRISFPSKKKEKEREPEETEDPAIYNPVNKDLRTVIDSPSRKDHSSKDQTRVDLGALAPEGLPKDVTAEEIAALAAAAARVSGAGAESNLGENNVNENKTAETAETAPKIEIEKVVVVQAEIRSEAGPETNIEAKTGSQPSAETSTAASTFAPSVSLQQEAAPADATKLAMPLAGVMAAVPSAAHESVSNSRELSSDEPVTMAVAAGAESAYRPSRWTAVAVALVPGEATLSLETEMQKAGISADQPAEVKSQTVPVLPPSEPTPTASSPIASIPIASVPMASIPTTQLVSTASRNETATRELAGGEAVNAEPAINRTEKTEAEKIEAEKTNAEKINTEKTNEETIEPAAREVEKSETEKIAETTASAVPQLAASEPPAPSFVQAAIAEVASLATEAVNAAVKQFERVAGSQVVAPPAPPIPSNSVSSGLESAPAPISVPAGTAEPSAHEKPASEFPLSPEPEKIQERPEQPAPVAASESQAVAATSISTNLLSEVTGRAVEKMETAQADIDLAKAVIAVTKTAEPEGAENPATDNSIAGGAEDMAKKESEMTANTAAAWASWRRIRDVGDKSSAQPDSAKGPVSAKEAAFEREEAASAEKTQDKAAMAVAAGAEKAPEEAVSPIETDPGEIANIVDSVLADLRPKIVEEISKKLGKKK